MTIYVVALAVAAFASIFVPVRYRVGTAVGASIFALALGPTLPGATAPATVIAAIIVALIPVVTTLKAWTVPPPYFLYVAVVALGCGPFLFGANLPPFQALVAVATLMIGAVATGLSEAGWRIVWSALGIVTTAVSLICVLESFVARRVLFAAEAYGQNPFVADSVRAQATLGHPLVAGFFCFFAVVVALRAERKVFLRMGMVALGLLGTVASGSTTTVLSAAAALAGWFLLGKAGRSTTLRLAIGAVVGVAVLGFSLVPTEVLDDLSERQTQHRLNSILGIPSLIADRPVTESLFGSGFGSAERLYTSGILTNVGFFAVDNQFVSALVTSGLLGMVAFILFLALCFTNASRLDRILLVSILLVFVGFDVLAWAPTGAIFLIFAANCLRKRERDGIPKTERRDHLTRSA